MSNLATMIMEGSGLGTSAKLTHSYDHEGGAGLIAMESAEALRDIFEAEFYVPNTCTIAAALEGASCVEESSQAAIMEASVKGAFAKIKDFFIKLKEKVKDFLHNIKRYLTGIFGNDVKWVTNYEKELTSLSNNDLKDYKVKMYDYSIIQVLDKAGIESKADSLLAAARHKIKVLETQTKGAESEADDLEDAFKDEFETYLKDELKDSDPDSIQKNAWSKMRNWAKSESDKDDVKVGTSEISKYIKEIKDGPKIVDKYDKMISGVDKSYNKAIKFVNECEKEVNNAKIAKGSDNVKVVPGSAIGANTEGNFYMSSDKASSYTACLRKYAQYLSKLQSVDNTINTAAKSALQERNKAYKKALTGAFGYAKKNNKGGK